MYLLDTNVVSELRKPKPHGAVVAWVESLRDDELYLSAVTIGEIQAGVEITREQDTVKAVEIETWLEQVSNSYNVLDLDADTMRIWARLMHRESGALIEDALIAACALRHNLIVATRNVKHFKHFGVPLLDPFTRSKSQ
ncbi:MAG: type II toxin-antitoxin system VapC family toxin [Propionibacteriaceae bacterium]|jgi:predicted nucleic acid-binding protein|nr:type II toxin-antitoxin system VapC family toxin [Propionibacteriaceae bacterium]